MISTRLRQKTINHKSAKNESVSYIEHISEQQMAQGSMTEK